MPALVTTAAARTAEPFSSLQVRAGGAADLNIEELTDYGEARRTPQTILTCYMEADEGSMREESGSRKRPTSAGGL